MPELLISAHVRLAAHAALLFAVGLFLSWPVVRYDLRPVAWPPLAIFRTVLKLLGRSPGVMRVTAVIFGFNSVAMFVYMASGFHPLLPKVFGVWTGMNIGIVLGMSRAGDEFAEVVRPTPGQWVPSARLSAVCGAAVLLLELPCFWLAVAMGISLGHRGPEVGYLSGLALRAQAFVALIVPALFLSALAEATAMRGYAARAE